MRSSWLVIAGRRLRIDNLGRLAETKTWIDPSDTDRLPLHTTLSYLEDTTLLAEQEQFLGEVGDPGEAVFSTTSMAYDSLRRLKSITTVAPEGFDNLTSPLTKVTRFGYDSRHRQTHVWGSAAMPMWQLYDEWGRLAEQRTFQDPEEDWDAGAWPLSPTDPAGGQRISWIRDARTGLVEEHHHHSGPSSSTFTKFTYDGLNRESVREWARDQVSGLERRRYTDYHDSTGELAGRRYRVLESSTWVVDDDTPDTEFTYDKLGRLATVTDALGERSFVYDTTNGSRGDLLREDLPSGYYFGRRIGFLYDAQGRSAGYQIGTSSDADLEAHVLHTWSSVTGRLSSITANLDPTAVGSHVSRTWSFSYSEGGGMPTGISTTATAGAFARELGYDEQRPWLLTKSQNSLASTSFAQYDYAWDPHGRMVEAQQTGTMFTNLYGTGGLTATYTYDVRDRLTATQSWWDDDSTPTELPDRRLSMTYDAASNRTSVERYQRWNTTEDEAEHETLAVTVNSLGQIEATEHPPRALFIGKSSDLTTAIQVDSDSTTTTARRAEAYFFDTRDAIETTETQWTASITQGAGSIPSAKSFVRRHEEDRQYDLDGNPIYFGTMAGDPLAATTPAAAEFKYDAENRLIEVTLPTFRFKYKYDYLNRRSRVHIIDLLELTQSDFDYVYVGGLLAGVVRTDGFMQDYGSPWQRQLFLWGPDRSGTREGAGGIGGLLSMVHGGGLESTEEWLVAQDGLGNVVAYVNAATGTRVAEFEYNAFGETVREGGTEVGGVAWGSFPFRYQNKFSGASIHGFSESTLEFYDFGQRWYEPSQGRFLNRDPLGTAGGANLYAYLGGRAFGTWDAWGWTEDGPVEPTRPSTGRELGSDWIRTTGDYSINFEMPYVDSDGPSPYGPSPFGPDLPFYDHNFVPFQGLHFGLDRFDMIGSDEVDVVLPEYLVKGGYAPRRFSVSDAGWGWIDRSTRGWMTLGFHVPGGAFYASILRMPRIELIVWQVVEDRFVDQVHSSGAAGMYEYFQAYLDSLSGTISVGLGKGIAGSLSVSKTEEGIWHFEPKFGLGTGFDFTYTSSTPSVFTGPNRVKDSGVSVAFQVTGSGTIGGTSAGATYTNRAALDSNLQFVLDTTVEGTLQVGITPSSSFGASLESGFRMAIGGSPISVIPLNSATTFGLSSFRFLGGGIGVFFNPKGP